ncbi:MFS transporter [Bacterioplanes sanyensis]|uniref:MFS transporter n=1 Tax=Bacterioplanes sanyensis TaxID=1249553 RepID=UPI00167A5E82|nr:MFS transporter [Bacterioplanes sanyensis]GGY59065.1 MFS transporter [Bacterioplanes sanyensis]
MKTLNSLAASRWPGWWLLIVVFVCGFFFRFAPASMASSIQLELSLSATALGLIASMQFWTYTLMQVPAGIFSDALGLRRAALSGASLTALGAMVFALSPGATGLMLGSALIGIGLAAVFVALMTYNAVWFEPHKHSLIMGATMLLAALGSVLAESPAAAALHYFSWRQIIAVFAGLTALAMVGLWLYCHNRPSTHTSKPLRRSNSGLLSGYRRVVKLPQVWCLFVCVAATNGTLYAFLGLWSTPMLVDGFAMPVSSAAHYATLALLVYGLGSLFSGWLSDRLQARKPLIMLATLLAAACWGSLAFMDWQAGADAMALFILLGFSGAQAGVIFSAAKESVASEQVGFATALINMGAFLAAAIIQSGFGVILDLASAGDSKTLAHYQSALLLPFAVALTGAVAALWLEESAGATAAAPQ